MNELEVLHKLLGERVQRLKDSMAEGSAADFPSHRYHCGEILGLLTAMREVEDLAMKKKALDE